MLHPLRRFVAWAGNSGGIVLTAMLIVVGGTWGFIKLASEV